ncbi:MAG: hypothetical protein GYB37_08740 [Algicola sp.]|nr:hypothetical protein [Algicola sp.]
MSPEANAQFFKKLKQQAEEKLLKKANKEVYDIFTGNKGAKEEEGVKEAETIKTDQSKSAKPTSGQQVKTTYIESDYLVYKSPIPAFKDIVIQKHKDLPRFGAVDSYMMRDNPKKVDLSKQAAEKRNLTGLGYSGFAHLVRIRMLKEHFKVMDKAALTQRTIGQIIEQEAKSSLAQKVLKEFAFDMGTDALKKEYFMNDWSGDGKSPFVREWGGHQADDFTENEKYVSFVNKYLDKILKWSEEFFPDGTDDFQLVHDLKFYGQYDFDKGGFWVQLPLKGKSLKVSSLDYFTEFLPQTSYGQEIANKVSQVEYINGYVLFKISPEKAEALINDKTVLLQLSVKVKSVFKEFQTSNPFVYGAHYTYHFLEPVMELYSDAQLTRKIGEIDLRNLIYKGSD